MNETLAKADHLTLDDARLVPARAGRGGRLSGFRPSDHGCVTLLPRETTADGQVAAMAHTSVGQIGRSQIHMTALSLGKKRRIPIINALAAMMTPATTARKRVIVA